MAYDLTLTGAGYNASGKFGQSLNAGYGYVTNNVVPLSLPITIEAWGKTTATGTKVLTGMGGCAYIAVDSAGKALANYGNSSPVNLTTTVAINDGVWHHFALVITSTGGKLYVDGALAASGAAADFSQSAVSNYGVGAFGQTTHNASFDWVGEVDDVAIWSEAHYTAAFTPPTAAISNSAANLVAVWHLDGNGVNSMGVAGSAATAVTLSLSASSGVVGAAVTITVGTNNPLTGAQSESVALTSNVAGTFSPTSVALNSTTATATATFTPSATGSAVVTGTATGTPTLTNGTSSTYTVSASDTTAPTFGSAQVANATPTIIAITMVEASGSLAASVPPTSAFTVSGGRTVTGVSISGLVVSVTVNTAYVSTDTITIAYTQPGANPRLQDASGNLTATFAAQAVTNNVTPTVTNSYDSTKILFSPYNWNVQSGYAKTINGGAYLKTLFGGTACTLTFDMTGLVAPYPILVYRLDGHGPWQTVNLAASVVLTMNSDTAAYQSHFLELVVRSTTETQNRWGGATTVALTGFTLDTGKSLSLPTALPLKGLYFGDSITEGVNTITNSGDTTVRSDATQGWAYQSARMLGAECGVVGFGGQGLTVTGSGSIPIFGSTYNMLYSGVSRSFASAPDYIVINQGTNDGGNNITTAATGVLNGLIAATPSATKIIVLRPFNGSHDSEWTAAIAACTAPSRITHTDTTGWFTSANSADTVHPYGYENIFHVAPLAAASIKSTLAGAPATTARTVTITLKLDATTLAASLTGLKVSFWDEASPDLTTTARYQSGTQTTDASGILTFSVNSTLASGGTGYIDIRGTGLHYCAPCVVA